MWWTLQVATRGAILGDTQGHAKSTSPERSETAGHIKMVGGKKETSLSLKKPNARVRSEHLQNVSVSTGVKW